MLGVQTVLIEQWWAIHEAQVRQSHIRQEVLRLERMVADVDNGFRGYVLMQQSSFLIPMVAAEGSIPGIVDGLLRLTSPWPDLQFRVRTVNERVTELLDAKRRLTLALERGGEEDVLSYIRGGKGLAQATAVAMAFRDLDGKLTEYQADHDQQIASGIEWVRWGLAATATGGFAFGIAIGRAMGRSVDQGAEPPAPAFLVHEHNHNQSDRQRDFV